MPPRLKYLLFLLLLFFVPKLSAQSDQSPPAAGTPEKKDSTRLVIAHFVQPDFPLEAMQQKLQGHVVIHLVVSTTGDVLSADPVSGNPIFTQSAVAAMKKWKFQPYIRNGQAVQIGYNMPYDFAMASQVHDHPDPDATAPSSSGSSSATAAAADEAKSTSGKDASPPGQPIRINQGVAQQMILHQIAPIYPDYARQRMIQGTVVLEGIIGKDGRVTNLHPISGPKELYDSAIGAVEQWRYKPFLLKGQPVEVQTTINVNYKLSH